MGVQQNAEASALAQSRAFADQMNKGTCERYARSPGAKAACSDPWPNDETGIAAREGACIAQAASIPNLAARRNEEAYSCKLPAQQARMDAGLIATPKFQSEIEDRAGVSYEQISPFIPDSPYAWICVAAIVAIVKFRRRNYDVDRFLKR